MPDAGDRIMGKFLIMGHKCYISFKTKDSAYKQYIQSDLGVDMIDKSLDEPIESDNEDYLSDSTVTIHLIGQYSAESLGKEEQRFIKRELQASLYNSPSNSRNGILGVVLPEVDDAIYKGSITCSTCGKIHNCVAVNDGTTVREFSYNYYIPNGKCSHREEERYCVLVKWSTFWANPDAWIQVAFAKRSDQISEKVRIYRL